MCTLTCIIYIYERIRVCACVESINKKSYPFYSMHHGNTMIAFVHIYVENNGIFHYQIDINN